MKNKKGFTLIEIMIVVVIIGVLASLALPKLGNQVKKASSAEAFSMLGALARAASQCYTLQDEAVADCDSIEEIETVTNAKFSNSSNFSYGTAVVGNKLTFSATYKAGGVISLAIDLDTGEITKCSIDDTFKQIKGVDADC